MMLVRAAAAGMDIGSAFSDLQAPLGCYRFTFLLQKAVEMCVEVKALGSALLSALEKKDAEALSTVRAHHETAVLRAARLLKEMQRDTAKTTLEGLRKTREVTNIRFTFYDKIEPLNAGDWAQLAFAWRTDERAEGSPRIRLVFRRAF